MVPIWSRIKSAAVSRSSSLALVGTVAGLTLAGALPAASAQAAIPACPETTLIQPFLKWQDSGYYSLVAGGGFEVGESAWTLSSKAAVASGSETFALTGKLGRSSLQLPTGASAQSPLTCVEPNDRTFRFLAHGEGGSAMITVSVIYEGLLGLISNTVKTGTVGSSWEPSPVLHTGAQKAAKLAGGFAHMSIRFEANKGTARIDDVYLDPRMR